MIGKSTQAHSALYFAALRFRPISRARDCQSRALSSHRRASATRFSLCAAVALAAHILAFFSAAS